MVDSTTLIVLATVVQTVVITLTLLVFIFQFRGQEKAIREQASQNLQGRYNDYIMGMLGRPEIAKLILQRSTSFGQGREVTPEDASLYGHLLVAYGILEEAFELRQKKWIDAETWGQWEGWLKVMVRQKEFREIHEVTEGTFDKRFQDHVSKLIAEM